MSENQRPQGLFLFSGGLDSLLASRLLKNQGVRIVGLRFRHSFLPPLDKAVREAFSSPLIEVDLRREFLQILRSPPNGFGKNANPCLDCKILFYTQARLCWRRPVLLRCSGDVVEQRPFLQRRQALAQIERLAQACGSALCQRLSPFFPKPEVGTGKLEAPPTGTTSMFEPPSGTSGFPSECSLTQVGWEEGSGPLSKRPESSEL